MPDAESRYTNGWKYNRAQSRRDGFQYFIPIALGAIPAAFGGFVDALVGLGSKDDEHHDSIGDMYRKNPFRLFFSFAIYTIGIAIGITAQFLSNAPSFLAHYLLDQPIAWVLSFFLPHNNWLKATEKINQIIFGVEDSEHSIYALADSIPAVVEMAVVEMMDLYDANVEGGVRLPPPTRYMNSPCAFVAGFVPTLLQRAAAGITIVLVAIIQNVDSAIVKSIQAIYSLIGRGIRALFRRAPRSNTPSVSPSLSPEPRVSPSLSSESSVSPPLAVADSNQASFLPTDDSDVSSSASLASASSVSAADLHQETVSAAFPPSSEATVASVEAQHPLVRIAREQRLNIFELLAPYANMSAPELEDVTRKTFGDTEAFNRLKQQVLDAGMRDFLLPNTQVALSLFTMTEALGEYLKLTAPATHHISSSASAVSAAVPELPAASPPMHSPSRKKKEARVHFADSTDASTASAASQPAAVTYSKDKDVNKAMVLQIDLFKEGEKLGITREQIERGTLPSDKMSELFRAIPFIVDRQAKKAARLVYYILVQPDKRKEYIRAYRASSLSAAQSSTLFAAGSSAASSATAPAEKSSRPRSREQVAWTKERELRVRVSIPTQLLRRCKRRWVAHHRPVTRDNKRDNNSCFCHVRCEWLAMILVSNAM